MQHCLCASLINLLQDLFSKNYVSIFFDEISSKALEEIPSEEDVEPEVVARFMAHFEQNFFKLCEKGIYFIQLILFTVVVTL